VLEKETGLGQDLTEKVAEEELAHTAPELGRAQQVLEAGDAPGLFQDFPGCALDLAEVALDVPECLADVPGRFLELTAHILELLIDLLSQLTDLLLHDGEGGVFRLGALQVLDLARGCFHGADQGIEEEENDESGTDRNDEDEDV
jgi:hypothetical protein